jgi:hypothetical protein
VNSSAYVHPQPVQTKENSPQQIKQNPKKLMSLISGDSLMSMQK